MDLIHWQSEQWMQTMLLQDLAAADLHTMEELNLIWLPEV